MYKIKKTVLESIIIASKKLYPLEFFSMLGGENKTINELVVVPAEFGEDFSTYRLDLVPIDKTIIGTIHSHPTPNNEPSEADLNSFQKSGEIHLIISYPYNEKTLQAYDNQGKKIKLKIVK